MEVLSDCTDSKQLHAMLLEMYLLYQPRPLDYNRHMTGRQWGFGPQAKALHSTGGSSREDREGRLFMSLYLITHRLR